MILDVHAHILTEVAMSRLQTISPGDAPRFLEVSNEVASLAMGGTVRYFPRGGWDVDQRLADMDKAGVDVQVLSVVPFTFAYSLDRNLGTTFARIQNEEIAGVVMHHPKRFVGLATVPLQDASAAADELRRAINDGLKGAAICSNINGKNLDSADLDPFWKIAAELEAFIFVHPQTVAAAERLTEYHLINLLGNPIDTSIAVASIIFGGVCERYPSLRLGFAHGGGFIPYQWGRLLRGWTMRAETRINLKGNPTSALRQLYFDTIVHSQLALKFLIDMAGTKHVVLGSDYPFDMGLENPVGDILDLTDLVDSERDAILGNTAQRLLGLQDV
jgi:aminocarboxymuconate-semialdehyde decarboxylase